MSDVQPKQGDKVRVSYEGVVEKVGVETIQLEVGSVHAKHGSGVIEILERADDRDPVGTVAERVSDGAVFVKMRINGWYRVDDSDSFCASVPDKFLVGRRVTGAVPGTPAAEAQSVKTDV